MGVKLEVYPSEQESVLMLLERVNDAQRIATMQMKETDAKKKGGKRKALEEVRRMRSAGVVVKNKKAKTRDGRE